MAIIQYRENVNAPWRELMAIKGEPGKDGIDGKDGVDGLPGKDGRDGVDGQPGKDGKDGANGVDGYTPVRGTDYWTTEDIATIQAYIDEAISNIVDGEEVSY